jgi:hypothetical protein
MHLIHAALFVSACGAGPGPPRVPVWSDRTELAVARQPQRIFVSPDLRELVILASSEAPGDGRLTPVRMPLHNSFAPEARVAVTPPVDNLRGDRFNYEYTIANGSMARDGITNIFLVVPSYSPGTEPAYYVGGRKGGEWLASIGSVVNARQRELDEREEGRNVFWASAWTEGLADSDSVNILPGRSMRGFEIVSSAMPGFTTMAVTGPSREPPQALLEQQVLDQATTLHVEDYFEVTTLTFGPMFVTGAKPAEVLKNYRLGVERLGLCSSIPHSAAFVEEISRILREPGIESKLGARLDGMKSKPIAPMDLELMNCLRLVARAFANRSLGGKY